MNRLLKVVVLWLLVGGLIYVGADLALGQGGTSRAVTQITSLTTGVTINATTGVITTVSATTAAVSKSTFTVTNSGVSAGSTVIAGVQNYAGTYATNGIPVVTVNNVVDGAFDINVVNVHASNALSGILKIGFDVR
jgi:hypothetical protein